MKATSVLRLPIDEFSAKVRVGPPVDDEEDYSFPHLGRSDSVETTVGAPIRDERCQAGVAGIPEKLFPEEEVVENGLPGA